MDISQIMGKKCLRGKTKARNSQIQTYPNAAVVVQSLKGRGGRAFLRSSLQLPYQNQCM